uniref:Uncharacterized protein n=1 Tax=Manihot esculenta TaxID=3983 RepID=A0A199UB91_MANES
MFYEQIVRFESQKPRMHPHLCSYEERLAVISGFCNLHRWTFCIFCFF